MIQGDRSYGTFVVLETCSWGWLAYSELKQSENVASHGESLKKLAATCERHQLYFGGIYVTHANKFRCSIERTENPNKKLLSESLTRN